MKKLLVFGLVLLLSVSVAHAFIYRTIGANAVPSPGYTRVTPMTGMATAMGGLQTAVLSFHPLAPGSQKAVFAYPGTRIFANLKLTKALPGSVPITEDVSFMMIAIYKDGSYDLYGTEDTGVIPSNIFRYDPALEVWTNGNIMFGGTSGDIVRFVTYVTYEGETKVLMNQMNVR